MGLSTKTAVNYHHAHAHRHLSPLLHQHLSHQHPSVTKSVTKNVIVIMDPRVVVKEEKVDITEDVIFNAPTISYSPTAITEAVTEEKVVVVKEAKVAITKTLATLSAKLSVNNKFQQMYSLCGCVCVSMIFTFDLLCFCFSFGKAKKEKESKKKKKKKKKITHTFLQKYKFHPCFFHDYLFELHTSPNHSYFFYIPRILSFIPSSLILFNYLLSLKEIMDDLIE